MGEMDEGQLLKAIQLARAGDGEAARPLLARLVSSDPHNEKAWIWLIEVLPIEQKQRAVELFNRANPDSILARKAREAIVPTQTIPANLEVVEPIPRTGQLPPLPVETDLVQMLRETYLPAQEVTSRREPDEKPVEHKPLANMGVSESEVAAEKVLQEARRPVDRRPSQERKWLFLEVGLLVVSVILVVILVLLMSEAGIFENIRIPLFAPSHPRVVVATPSMTNTVIPVTPTLTTTPSPWYTKTATPVPATEQPSPTAFLVTPSYSPVILPDNTHRLSMFYQSYLPENALVSPSLRYMLILDGSSQVHPFEFNTLRRLFVANLPSDSAAVAMFSPDETSLAVGIGHGGVIVYEFPSGKMINSLSTSGITLDNQSALAYSSDGHYLIASSGNNYNVWDLKTGAIIGQGTLPTGPYINGQPTYGPVTLVGKTIYTPCGSAICATDVSTQKELQNFAASDRDFVSKFALSTSGDILAVQTLGKENLFTITLYKTNDGTVLQQIDTALTMVWDLAFTPGGRLLVAWGQDSVNGQDALAFIDTEKLSLVSLMNISKLAQPGVDNSFTQSLLFTPDGEILALRSPHALRIYSLQQEAATPTPISGR